MFMRIRFPHGDHYVSACSRMWQMTAPAIAEPITTLAEMSVYRAKEELQGLDLDSLDTLLAAIESARAVIGVIECAANSRAVSLESTEWTGE